MQVIVTINDSTALGAHGVVFRPGGAERPRPHRWVSASGDHASVVESLMKSARRDMNLTASEDAEIETLVRTWTPGDDYPLPKDEDQTRTFPCGGFTLTITARSDERVAMVGRETDALLGISSDESADDVVA